jgi:predicted amino acid racemase
MRAENRTFKDIGKYFDFSENWASKIIKNYDSVTGMPLGERQKCGPKPKISENYNETIDALIKLTEHRSYTSKEVVSIFRERDFFDVSARTMRRKLQALGVRKTRPVKDVLTDLHKLKRLDWCRTMQDELLLDENFFNDWLISDEVRFSLDGKCVPQVRTID